MKTAEITDANKKELTSDKISSLIKEISAKDIISGHLKISGHLRLD